MRNILTLICVLCGLTATTHAATFDKTDLTIVSGAEKAKLYKVCKMHNIELVAEPALKAEEKYGVNAFVLIAIGVQESSWYTIPHGRNNFHGQIGLSFNSLEDGFLNAAKNISTNYLNPKGKWYKGTSTQSMQKIWCGTDSNWARDINSIANQLLKEYNALD